MESVFELRKFVVPEFVFGHNSRLLVGQYASNLGAKKILIVTDKGVTEAGWLRDICDSLAVYALDWVVFSHISSNPRDAEVMEGARLYSDNECNFIVALGGGSPMDCAKGISIVASNGGHVLDYEGIDCIEMPGPPLICIPTTAGTAADISQFAIITDSKKGVKRAIISKFIVPELALLDNEVLTTMPPYLMACTTLDALTHAIEAYVSSAHSAVTDMNALRAIELTHLYAKETYEHGSLENYYYLMLASLHAGMAFSNASLGMVHAMAHSLGGLLDLPHGECNAIILSRSIEFNFTAVQDRYCKIAKLFDISINGRTMEEVKALLIAYLDDLRQSLGIPEKFIVSKVDKDVIHQLAVNAVNDPCMVTNPVFPSVEEVEKLYESLLRTE